MIFVSVVTLMFLAGALAEPPSALDTLVESERRFSALSVEKGMREAFLNFLAEDGTLFRPLPVNGKKAWETATDKGAKLVWEPGYAEVSAAGDLGYTTGPWELRPPAGRDSARTSYGHFISIWKRQPDGAWRVAADIGVEHRQPDPGKPAVGSGHKPTLHEPTGIANARVRKPPDLSALDRLLGWAMKSKGVSNGFSIHAAPDIRFNTEGAFPSLGIPSARAALDTVKGSMQFVSQSGQLAGSGDLGYSYGLIRKYRDVLPAPGEAPTDSSVYLHVWRRGAGGDWKLALAVWNPVRL